MLKINKMYHAKCNIEIYIYIYRLISMRFKTSRNKIVAELITDARGFAHVAVQIRVKTRIEREWRGRPGTGSWDLSEIRVRMLERRERGNTDGGNK